MTVRGFPHSDIRVSTLAYSSTRHFGVCPVLLRLLAPRHPPCALSNFTIVRLPFCFALRRHSTRSVSHVRLGTLLPSLISFLALLASRNPNWLLAKCHCNTLNAVTQHFISSMSLSVGLQKISGFQRTIEATTSLRIHRTLKVLFLQN